MTGRSFVSSLASLRVWVTSQPQPPPLALPLTFPGACPLQVQRLENQVARYKAAAETAEKSEEELKGEKRKLQREVRTESAGRSGVFFTWVVGMGCREVHDRIGEMHWDWVIGCCTGTG